jgi:hypothetical protein
MEKIEIKSINTHINNDIITGQLFGKESGFFVTNNSKLFRITSDSTNELVNTPDSINITNLVFKNENEGIIIGIPKDLNNKTNHTISPTLLLVLAVVILTGLIVGIYKGLKKWKLKFLYVLVPLITFIIIYFQFPFGENEQDEKLYFENGSHYYSETNTYDGMAAFTNNGGKTWKTIIVPTNFELTGLIYLNNKYYISSFASQQHLDGDVWCINPQDKKISISSFATKRGLNGLTVYNGNKILAYGTERVTAFLPESKMVKTKGEIIIFDEKLNTLLPLDIEGENQITSLSLLPDNTIWAISSDKKIYRLSENKWRLVNIDGFADPTKIIFLDAEVGFILNKNGQMKYTENQGKNWTDHTIKEGVKILEIKKREAYLEIFGTKGFIGILTSKNINSANSQ